MKQIILDLTVSLDGYIERKHKEVDWIIFDDEIGEELSDFADEIDTVLYGRISYELFGNYIPPDEARGGQSLGRCSQIWGNPSGHSGR